MLESRVLDPLVQIDIYDGPLDLLLYLVRRDGIDVRNLPLVHITREYLAAMEELYEFNIDMAGEFILMAATLCELKSRELLPRSKTETEQSDDPQEEEDPRIALARRILQYQRFKEAAENLDSLQMLGRDVFKRQGVAVSWGDRPVDPGVDSLGLLDHYRAAMNREVVQPVHEVHREELSWAVCVHSVLQLLDDGEERSLDELLSEFSSRAEKIMTFLAVLELVRLQMLEIAQRTHLSPILLRSMVKHQEADLSMIPEAL